MTLNIYIEKQNGGIQRCMVELPMKTSLKLLGFGSGPLLRATYHTDLPIQGIPPGIRDLRLLSKSQWGRNTDTFPSYHTAFIRPVIEYVRPPRHISAKSPMEKADVYQNPCILIVSVSSDRARAAKLRALFDIPLIRRRCSCLEAFLYGGCVREPSSRPAKCRRDCSAAIERARQTDLEIGSHGCCL